MTVPAAGIAVGRQHRTGDAAAAQRDVACRSKQTAHWVVAPSCNRMAATMVAPVLTAAQRKAVAQNNGLNGLLLSRDQFFDVDTG
ncbi:MAG: hypothetical protein IPK66_05125 [Rhodospirillales bacterium]|nr:hypothetical protein [Rhodospirillales bacterium]